MKTSTILRKAARLVAKDHANGKFRGCCSAIRVAVFTSLKDGVTVALLGRAEDATQFAKESLWVTLGLDAELGAIFTHYWWPVSYYNTPLDEEQNARVIGLLLAAEILKEEGK